MRPLLPVIVGLSLLSLTLSACGDKDTRGTGTTISDGGAGDGGTSDSGTSDGGAGDGGTSDGGTSDGGTTVDADKDGWTVANGDCDDTDAAVNPDATEVCDEVDDDCDGLVDDDDPGVTGTSTWYVDADSDGYGDAASGTRACTAPSGTVSDSSDCDDGDGGVYPGALEVCGDAVDNDCDGVGQACKIAGTVDLSLADAKLVGEAAGDHAGRSVSGAGDVDGDGHDDLLVGAYGEDSGGTDAGAAYLVLGPVSGTVDLSSADAKMVGEVADDNAGWSVSGAGDMDGDGYDDLLVGAYRRDSAAEFAGAAYLVLGPRSGTVNLSSADAKLVGEAEDDYADWIVSGAGDVDGDGYNDLLVGACNGAWGISSDGATYLLLGPVSGTVDLSSAEAKLIEETADDEAGHSVSGAGDVDGDGHDDLLVGAYGEDSGGESSGAAYLVLGPVSGTVNFSSADAKFVGEAAGDSAGRSVSGAGDVDGDGHDDLLVGAYLESSGGWYSGAAYLVLGPVSGTVDLSSADAKMVGEVTNDHAGYSVSGAGDVDGDGHDDLLVGAYLEDSGGSYAGAAYLVLGPVSDTVDLSSADAKLVGEAAGDDAGVSVSGAGDVDGDGYDDLLVGAYGEDSGGSYAGAAYLLYGGGI